MTLGPLAAYALMFLAVVATAFSQIAFKHYHVSHRRESLLTAIVLFTCIPPMTFLAVRALGVGQVYVFASLTYGLVAFLGWRLFGERVSRNQLQGLALITLGCILYTL